MPGRGAYQRLAVGSHRAPCAFASSFSAKATSSQILLSAIASLLTQPRLLAHDASRCRHFSLYASGRDLRERESRMLLGRILIKRVNGLHGTLMWPGQTNGDISPAHLPLCGRRHARLSRLLSTTQDSWIAVSNLGFPLLGALHGSDPTACAYCVAPPAADMPRKR